MWDRRALEWMLMTPEQRRQKVNNAIWRANFDMGKISQEKEGFLMVDLLRQRYRTNAIQLMLNR